MKYIQYDGNWPPVIKFLDEQKYQIPFLSEPDVRKEADGRLRVTVRNSSYEVIGTARIGIGVYLVAHDGELGPYFATSEEEPK